MTNEELAELIKEGKNEYCDELWKQLERLFLLKCNSFYARRQETCTRRGLEFEDLMQMCYFVMLGAVRAYNPEKGFKLNTYIDYHFLNVMNEALGIRGHQKQDSLNHSSSLNATIDNDDEIELIELIPDETAQAAFEYTERDMLLKELHELLEGAISGLSDLHQRVLRMIYYEGYTKQEIAASFGSTITNITEIERRACSTIRKRSYARKLRMIKDDVISSRAYIGTGYSSFRYCGGSSEELTVEYLDRHIPKEL